jgi:hypothetical protein
MDGLTGSEIAGFVVGGLLLGATIAAPKVDGFIASSQRRSLPFPFPGRCLLFHNPNCVV